MSRVRTYYKLVARTLDGWRSWNDSHGPGSLGYAVGKRTVPEFGGVIAFETEREAVAFWNCHRRSYGTSALVRGRGVARELSRFRAVSGFYDDDHVLQRAWEPEDSDEELYPCERAGWPRGTVALEWFEPEAEVAA